MFTRVSATFPVLRSIMAARGGQPDVAILAPDSPELRVAGQSLPLRATEIYDWTALAALARNDVRAVELAHLDGAPLPGLRTVLVLAHASADLSAADTILIENLLDHGGAVVTSLSVAASLTGAEAGARVLAGNGALRVWHISTARGMLVAVDGMPVENLFADSNSGWAGAVWRQVLHLPVLSNGYRTATSGTTLLYSGVAGTGSSITIEVPVDGGPRTLNLYDAAGAMQQTIQFAHRSGPVPVFLPRRNYALANFGA
jgi:hypothetical protein